MTLSMIASAAAAVGAGVPVGTGEAVGVGLGSGDAEASGLVVGSTDALAAGVGLGLAEAAGDVEAEGVPSGLAVAAPGDGDSDDPAADPAGVAVAVGAGLGDGVGRVIGTTMIEPPVVDALDSTTAACGACGARTTDPGRELSDAIACAPAFSGAHAASSTHTAFTLAMLTVYDPSAPRSTHETGPGATAIGVAPAAADPGTVGAGEPSPTPVEPSDGRSERPAITPTISTAAIPTSASQRIRGLGRASSGPGRAARSRSSATEVRAHRSRGGSGTGSARRSSRSSA